MGQLIDTFLHSLHRAPAGYFAPLRIRLWRYVAREGLASYFRAVDLVADGRLGPDGRLRP